MTVTGILGLGFALGMRHATDADHVVAVSAIVARERTLRAAAPIGILWGLGHTVTVFLVGGVIILFDVVIPPHVGLAMEFCVALMLVLLGALNIGQLVRKRYALSHAHASHAHGHPHASSVNEPRPRSMRPLWIGTIHGLAGSAAIALLVLGTIRDAFWALGYLVVFGAGTLAGMLLITLALALPVAATARRFERLHRTLGVLTGVVSLAFGALLIYDIAFVHRLFSANPHWTPQ
ncbi:MAG: high-affinity nickel-transport family protein [Pseudomonadota bacterium]